MEKRITCENIRYMLVLLSIWLIVCIWSVINVQDTYLTWILESLPAFIWIAVLASTFSRFRFSDFMYTIMLIHMIVLFVGAHYSYAQVPLGFWMEDWFGFERNNYDKIGHFMQGVSPTLITFVILRRRSDIPSKGLVYLLCFSVAMMVSAVYEIIEWAASMSNPTDTEAFLGTQGYIWDTQSDMFLCSIGSMVSILILITLDKTGKLNKTMGV